MIEVYRLGYYNGDGARLIHTVTPHESGMQPECVKDDEARSVDCGNWSVNVAWESEGQGRTTGLYVGRLVRAGGEDNGWRGDNADGMVKSHHMKGRVEEYDYEEEDRWETGHYGGKEEGSHEGRLEEPHASHTYFVIRPPVGGKVDVYFQTSETTWNAYNCYGGTNTYGYNCDNPGVHAGCDFIEEWRGLRSYKASFNRPYATRSYRSVNMPLGTEYPMVRWLERNGFNVGYYAGGDTEREGVGNGARVFLSVGHDEYWGKGQREKVERFRDGGGNLVFASCNEVFWKIRYEDDYRTMVVYKETHEVERIDDGEWTGTWRDGRRINPEGSRPENELTGAVFMVNAWVNEPLVVGSEHTKHRFWRNTQLFNSTSSSTALVPGIIGHEADVDINNGHRPAGLIHLSTTKIEHAQVLHDEGSTFTTGTYEHHVTMYRSEEGRRNGGGLVLGTGTCQWSWGLDGTHDVGGKELGNNVYSLRVGTDNFRPRGERDIQQATVNTLWDMGVRPGGMQEDLIEGEDGDIDVEGPVLGEDIVVGELWYTGTAEDKGGIVAGVEVSEDAGCTWERADCKDSQGTCGIWKFRKGAYRGPRKCGVGEGKRWCKGTEGICVRAVDDWGNLEYKTYKV